MPGQVQGSASEKSILKKSNGQFVIEAVLIMVISSMLFMSFAKWFRDKGVLENILAKPWSKIANMIEKGNWTDPKGNCIHPNNPECVATNKQ